MTVIQSFLDLLSGVADDYSDCQHGRTQCWFEVDDICYIHPDYLDDEDGIHVRPMAELVNDYIGLGRPFAGVAMRHFPTNRPVSDRELDGWTRFAVLPHREPPKYRKGE